VAGAVAPLAPAVGKIFPNIERGACVMPASKIENNATFRAMWVQGLTCTVIGERIGAGRRSVAMAARRFGYPKREWRAGPVAPKVRIAAVPTDVSKKLIAPGSATVKASKFTPAQDDLIIGCRGKYCEFAALAERWVMPSSQILARWHLLRVQL
jgi:hypothetical protein